MSLMSASECRMRAFPAVDAGVSDSVLDALISATDAAIARWCGFGVPDSGQPTMQDTTYTRYFDWPSMRDSRILRLAPRPVVSITSVSEDSAGTFTYSTSVSSGSYVLRGSEGDLLRTDGGWTEGYQYTKVVFVAGFATPPDDLLQGAAMAVRYLYDARRRLGVSAAQGGDTQETYAGEALLFLTSWPTEIRRLLGPFRLGEVGCG